MVTMNGYKLRHRSSKGSIFCDNQSVIHLSKHQLHNEKTKRIDARLHFVRDVTPKGKVQVCKVYTDDNATDMLTKSLPTAKFRHYEV